MAEYTRQQKKEMKKRERTLRQNREKAYNITSVLIRYWPSFANVVVSTVICFLVIQRIPTMFENWGASDPSQYTGMLIGMYIAIVLVWLAFIFFSIRSVLKDIKKSKE